MLQVDPTKRIRIDDLLRHRWLINTVYSEPVKWESIYQVEIPLDFSRQAKETRCIVSVEQTGCRVHS